MRNSFSLPVYFLQVLKSDVTTFFILRDIFLKTASKMKLILLTALVLRHAGHITANEHYGFPPQFQKPNSGIFASDSSIYLPPESHTPVPYFPIKNSNNLPFPYLPPTGTKAPSIYPSPFPVILSSTLVPIFDDDDEKEHEDRTKLRMSSTPPPMPSVKRNGTQNNPHGQQSQQAQRREMRQMPKMQNYHNPIDRIDMRFPTRDFPSGPSTPNPINQTPRNMIISVDTHRNDRGIDQIRAPSAQNPHYIPAPGFTISSTTEPAIPILRLSNEMDLDGSFSYEALGADQTHYVQHSHMENMGTEKEEQVVEGSYSYVGDNGQTYTVHYIADSNGFRASGEHLPVAPPIPEIIQRAVQYNLAEEAKKPPHLRSWQVNENEYDNSIDKNHNYAQPPPPPPRNLFTGRTPEAFSYSFGQGSNSDNNLATSASSQVPVKTNSEFNIDQSRKSNGPISPQITFLASQGAHVPSMNNLQQQQSISRVFSNEKSAMPQLINYDAGIKEAEQEANKGLWRWQYGLNSNNANQTPEKNTISRSFGEDDIMINFNEMTPEQYTKMLQSQLEQKDNSASSQLNVHQQNNQNQQDTQQYQNDNGNNYYSTNFNYQPSMSTEATSTYAFSTSFPENVYTKEMSTVSQTTSNNFNQNNYVSPKPSVTYSYDDNDNPDNVYESRRIKALHVDTTTKPSYNRNSIPVSNQEQRVSYNNIWSNAKDLQQHLQNEPKSVTQVPTFYNTVASPQNMNIYNSEFQPIKPIEEQRQTITTTTTTTTTTASPLESTTEDLFKTNIFLKSLFSPKKTEQKNFNQIVEEPKKAGNKVVAETKADKIPKFIQYQTKTHNELKPIKNKKPMDLSDMINYINMKNYFESNKVKPKSNTFGYNSNYDNRNEMRYVPTQYDQTEEQDEEYNIPQPKNSLRSLDHPQQDEFRGLTQLRSNLHNLNQNEELRGMIKNYKVLQRNNHARHTDSGYQNRKELNPSSFRLQAGLPPLGRAGPSMKTYLPPTYI